MGHLLHMAVRTVLQSKLTSAIVDLKVDGLIHALYRCFIQGIKAMCPPGICFELLQLKRCLWEVLVMVPATALYLLQTCKVSGRHLYLRMVYWVTSWSWCFENSTLPGTWDSMSAELLMQKRAVNDGSQWTHSLRWRHNANLTKYFLEIGIQNIFNWCHTI